MNIIRKKHVIIALGVLLLGFLLWYFREIVTYILISVVLSLIGQPIVKKLDTIKLKGKKLPHAFNSFLALFVIIIGFLLFIGIFIPIIINQAQIISKIDIVQLQSTFSEPLLQLQYFLEDYELIPPGETIEETVSEKFVYLIQMVDFSKIANSIVQFTGSIFIGVFSILFITFFFIKDEKLFYNTLMLLTPADYQDELQNILKAAKKLLTRYFVGLLLQLLTVIVLLTIGISILGIKNAMIIGFFGGLMNIIPYLGPIIGTTIGVLLGVSGNLTGDFYTDIIPLVIKIIVVFGIVNFIDNMILQPTIFSNSVKAHPLEIFLVTLIAGSVAGILGMVLAIPAYTFMRIVAKEFFQNSRFVKSLTKNL